MQPTRPNGSPIFSTPSSTGERPTPSYAADAWSRRSHRHVAGPVPTCAASSTSCHLMMPGRMISEISAALPVRHQLAIRGPTDPRYGGPRRPWPRPANPRRCPAERRRHRDCSDHCVGASCWRRVGRRPAAGDPTSDGRRDRGRVRRPPIRARNGPPPCGPLGARPPLRSTPRCPRPADRRDRTSHRPNAAHNRPHGVRRPSRRAPPPGKSRLNCQQSHLRLFNAR